MAARDDLVSIQVDLAAYVASPEPGGPVDRAIRLEHVVERWRQSRSARR